MDSSIRAAVAARAQYCCEYCQINEADDAFKFHVEHIIPLKHSGSSELDNLAFACQHCNLHKGPNLSGIDPQSGNITSLFNPRQQAWSEHFETNEPLISGSTAPGRTTVQVLAMNDPDRVKLRALLKGQDPDRRPSEEAIPRTQTHQRVSLCPHSPPVAAPPTPGYHQ